MPKHAVWIGRDGRETPIRHLSDHDLQTKISLLERAIDRERRDFRKLQADWPASLDMPDPFADQETPKLQELLRLLVEDRDRRAKARRSRDDDSALIKRPPCPLRT